MISHDDVESMSTSQPHHPNGLGGGPAQEHLQVAGWRVIKNARMLVNRTVHDRDDLFDTLGLGQRAKMRATPVQAVEASREEQTNVALAN
jgi:hypothetical protein